MSDGPRLVPSGKDPLPPNIVNGKTLLTAVGKLIPHPKNPRQGDVGAIAESIAVNGFYGSLVVQKSTSHVCAGNHRLLAAVQLGYEKVPVTWIDVDDETAERILLVDNRSNELASNDPTALAELLTELAGSQGLEGTGYDGDDLDELLADLADPPQHDHVPEKPETPKSKPGEVYDLGPHRLMCGDATSPEDVAKLLAGNAPTLMVTDPPYGVDYDPAWRQRAAEEGKLAYAARRVGEVANDERSDWTEAYELSPAHVAYVWHADVWSAVVSAGLEDAGFTVRSQIIWAKPHFPISRGHYHWQHEPCWYAVKKGETGHWIGDRKQTTLWNITLDKNVDGGHSTQKPVECMGRPMRNHSGDVYDPFVGSGTTMVAAESYGRRCYAMEIDPGYCDVVRRRYAGLVGNEEYLP